MFLAPEILDEKNYTGGRLVQIKSQTVYKLKKEIDKIQKEANPILNKMEKLGKQMEPGMVKIRELQKQIAEIQEEIKPIREQYDIEHKKVEVKDQRATLIKNKIYPIVQKELDGTLAEFEEGRNIVDKKGVLFVNVVDKLEEYVKQQRASKKIDEQPKK